MLPLHLGLRAEFLKSDNDWLYQRELGSVVITTQLSSLVQVTDRAVVELQKLLGVLENHLKLRTYLVGETVTLADVTVACSLLLPYKYVSLLVLAFYSRYPDFWVFFPPGVSMQAPFPIFYFSKTWFASSGNSYVFCFLKGGGKSEHLNINFLHVVE